MPQDKRTDRAESPEQVTAYFLDPSDWGLQEILQCWRRASSVGQGLVRVEPSETFLAEPSYNSSKGQIPTHWKADGRSPYPPLTVQPQPWTPLAAPNWVEVEYHTKGVLEANERQTTPSTETGRYWQDNSSPAGSRIIPWRGLWAAWSLRICTTV